MRRWQVFAWGLAGLAAKQRGFGHPRKAKAITARQIKAIRAGLTKVLKSRGLSVVLATRVFRGIRGVTPEQMRALGRDGSTHARGGVALAGGTSTGGRFQPLQGSGIKLAGKVLPLREACTLPDLGRQPGSAERARPRLRKNAGRGLRMILLKRAR
jgi:hypothetical protein